MKDRPDRHSDRALRAVEPTQLKSHHPVVLVNLEFHHVALEAVEDVTEFGRLGYDFNVEASLDEL